MIRPIKQIDAPTATFSTYRCLICEKMFSYLINSHMFTEHSLILAEHGYIYKHRVIR